MFKVIRYGKIYEDIWNDFVEESGNGTFLLNRQYIDYHNDRFDDHSLLLYKDDELLGLLPMNVENITAYSHQGLTYGGFILPQSIHLFSVINMFIATLKYLHTQGYEKLIYKSIPLFYHKGLTQADQYIMFLLDSPPIRVDTGFVINLPNQQLISQRRMRCVNKAISNNVEIRTSMHFESFWGKVLEPNLKHKHGVKPVHSLEEIMKLHNRFPKNILLFEAWHKNEIVAGTTIFSSNNWAHAQYISCIDSGRDVGAIDLLFYDLIVNRFNKLSYFSFGIANEENGRKMNKGLMDWKEGFGTSIFTNNFYSIETRNYQKLLDFIEQPI